MKQKGVYMNIDKDKLSKHDTYITHYNGYRIVYYYDNHHEPRLDYMPKKSLTLIKN